MRFFSYLPRSIFVTATVVMTAIAAFSQSSEFKYQGKLDDTGVPANGTYEMQFKLFKLPSTQVGPTLTQPVTVTNGIFDVALDFTETAFDGGTRLLEIAVKRVPADPFVVLSPRVTISSAPHALRSKVALNAANATNADNAQALGGLGLNRFVITDTNGDVAIGAASTGSKLTVGGRIESTSGGIKFPDATTQTTAGIASVSTAAPLTGNGTPASPVGISSPLQTRDIDIHGRQPFGISTVETNGTIYTVPAGKRLVVEYLSGFRTLPATAPLPVLTLQSITGSTPLLVQYIPPETWSESTGTRQWIFSRQVRLYVEPGNSVNIFYSGIAGSTVTFLTGYFVDVP